jgi:hypothetical protein
MVTADIGKQWMLAFSALALGNTFPLLPFRLVDPGATAHAQLFSGGRMTDAIVSSIGFIVLIITPFPLWRRLAAVPEWRRLKPVMMAARIVGPSAGSFWESPRARGTQRGSWSGSWSPSACSGWARWPSPCSLFPATGEAFKGDRAHSRGVVSAKRGCADGET